MDQKTCNQCGQSKPANRENFRVVRKKRKDGTAYNILSSPCKTCVSAKKADAWANKPLEVKKEIHKRSMEIREVGGRDREVEYKNKLVRTYDADKERFHRLKIRVFISKLKRLTNRKAKEFGYQSWRSFHTTCAVWDDPSLSSAQKYRMRYRIDSEFNLLERMRNQQKKKQTGSAIGDIMRDALVRNGSSNKVERLLGYTIQELHQHLEARFVDGMDWDAFRDGLIHIDHIIPQAAFDLSDPDQWVRCWSLDNLQPLWAEHNIAKSDIMPGCPNRSRGRHYKKDTKMA